MRRQFKYKTLTLPAKLAKTNCTIIFTHAPAAQKETISLRGLGDPSPNLEAQPVARSTTRPYRNRDKVEGLWGHRGDSPEGPATRGFTPRVVGQCLLNHRYMYSIYRYGARRLSKIYLLRKNRRRYILHYFCIIKLTPYHSASLNCTVTAGL